MTEDSANPVSSTKSSQTSSREEFLRQLEAEYLAWRDSNICLFNLVKLPPTYWDTLDHWGDFLYNGSVAQEDVPLVDLDDLDRVAQHALYQLADDWLDDEQMGYALWVRLRALTGKREEEFVACVRLWSVATQRLLQRSDDWWQPLIEELAALGEAFFSWTPAYQFVTEGLLGEIDIDMGREVDSDYVWSLVETLDNPASPTRVFSSDSYAWEKVKTELGAILETRNLRHLLS